MKYKIMLFDRFVFVVYLLFHYTCFLIGLLYKSSFASWPLLAMSVSLLSIVVVSLYQLQKLVKMSVVGQSDRWSTILWSGIHILLSFLFFCENIQAANILIVLCFSGLILSVIICIVAVCSCYVIIQNSRDWTPHVHLTCVTFWVVVQYMSVQLPMDEISYVTTVPVVAMAGLRVLEHIEDGVDVRSVLEWVLWALCIFFHVCLDFGWWTPYTFYWLLFNFLVFMVLLSGHWRDVCTVVMLPYLLCGLAVYTLYRYSQGYRSNDISSEITKMYEKLTAAPPLEPFEIGEEGMDFDTPL